MNSPFQQNCNFFYNARTSFHSLYPEVKIRSTEGIIPTHDDTVRKVLGNRYQSKWNHCCDFTVLYQRDLSLGHRIPLKSIVMMSVSCFQRHQRKETSISVLGKDEEAARLDAFFEEVQKLIAE